MNRIDKITIYVMLIVASHIWLVVGYLLEYDMFVRVLFFGFFTFQIVISFFLLNKVRSSKNPTKTWRSYKK